MSFGNDKDGVIQLYETAGKIIFLFFFLFVFFFFFVMGIHKILYEMVGGVFESNVLLIFFMYVVLICYICSEISEFSNFERIGQLPSCCCFVVRFILEQFLLEQSPYL